jgi:NADPH:quinone reductase-like Zn-dependent oxidoreductase
MKAWQIGKANGIDALTLAEVEKPTPGAGEVLVKVIACGLNYRDIMVANTNYGAPQPEKRVPTSDGVGVVEAVGDGVTGLTVGDRVIAPHFLSWLDGAYSPAVFGRDMGVTADGWLSEYVVLPADAALVVPQAISDETAATLSVAASTVWHAMVAFGEAGAGKIVLAQGTGGIAIFALQLAKALGAQFAITSSSDDKLARAREMGADFTVNYAKTEKWGTAVTEATGGRGADIVVDTLGFPALGQTIAATAVNGRIGTLGALSGAITDPANASQADLIFKNVTIKGIASGSRDMLAAAMEVVAEHGIAMVVDSAFDFNDAPAAYRHLESGAHFGKVMVRIG